MWIYEIAWKKNNIHIQTCYKTWWFEWVTLTLSQQLLSMFHYSGVASLIIGRGANIHIFVFTDHKNNRFQKKFVMKNTNIWILPHPQIISSLLRHRSTTNNKGNHTNKKKIYKTINIAVSNCCHLKMQRQFIYLIWNFDSWIDNFLGFKNFF